LRPSSDSSVALRDRQEPEKAVEKNLTYARNLHVEHRVLDAKNPAQAIVDFAHLHPMTQIFAGRQHKSRRFGIGRTLVQKLLISPATCR
jgi:K+-sensing histidine kinase KdpD